MKTKLIAKKFQNSFEMQKFVTFEKKKMKYM